MKFTDRQIIVLLGLAVSLPVFFIGISGHDAASHLILSRLFAEQFFSGDLYPRWLFQAEAGFGSPALYHFSVAHYYITLIFYPLHYIDTALNLPSGYLALYSTAILGIILSGLSMYKYLRLKTEAAASLLGAIFYMTALYHLGIDLYLRFAFSEIWAFVLIPLCLYFIEKKSLTMLALAFAALIFTHLLTTIMFLPVLAAIILLEKKWELFLSLFLGFVLAAIYWLPAISDLDLISPQVGVGIYSIDKNFLNPKTPEGAYLTLAAILTLGFIHIPFKKRTNMNFLWLAILFSSIFMAVSISAIIWKIIPQLAVLSFPWRFLTLAVLAATIFAAQANRKIVITLIIINIIMAYPALTSKNTQSAEPYLKANMLTVDDFRSKWTEQELVSDNGFKTPGKLQNLKYDDVKLDFKPREIIVHSARAGLIAIPQFYFPNWQSSYELSPQAKTGLIQVNLPEPATFSIKFIRNRAENIGLAISLFSLLFILLLSRLKK